MHILKIINKIISDIFQWYVTADSENYVSYLRKKGVKIGDDVKFYNPKSNVVDITRPYLLTIGDKVKITNGVKILTHGFDWCVLRECYQRPFGSAREVIIGNNVFIGMNAIVLKGVNIGDNVVIGAGAVVTRNIPSNSVVTGNPARVVSSINEHYLKYCNAELLEAKQEAKAILQRYKRLPRPDDFREFFYLFVERTASKFGSLPVERQVGDYMQNFLESNPQFNSFEEFLIFCDIPSPKDI